jgi:hypothetical protein
LPQKHRENLKNRETALFNRELLPAGRQGRELKKTKDIQREANSLKTKRLCLSYMRRNPENHGNLRPKRFC